MFDVSASELLVIGAVALIVIGPKELPGVLRMVGQTVGKLKRMAGEFRTQFDEAMREADLHEIQKTVSDTQASVSKFNPLNTIRNEISSTVNDMKVAKGSIEADIAKPVAGAAEQGPAVVKLDPLPDIEPVRLQPDLPTPEKPVVLSTPVDPVVAAPAAKAQRKPRAKTKPAGEGA